MYRYNFTITALCTVDHQSYCRMNLLVLFIKRNYAIVLWWMN